MSTTYRAAYINEMVLTSEDDAHLSDDDMLKAALEEAKRADLIDESATNAEEAWPRMTAKTFLRDVSIGDFTR